ncbi:hypothetical protein ACPFUC_001896 [Vibrio cholerae]|jgi:hypothetical protein|uniref:hypothetical protein n=1 Tax=Vibrio fluvialis TaxID=676 RepID=UPI0025742617|nr:hypothetical protein [Vibrio fluvialis]EGR4421472.1 hypothetical protein [Vibrio cholerae]BEI26582.1 hypothetical protein KKIDH5335_49140 [Vibrio fluvialis]
MPKVFRMTQLSNVTGGIAHCEVCNTHANTVYMLAPQKVVIDPVTRREYLTSHGETRTIGHKDCLSGLTH